ncbi:hypothetical protein D0U02_15185 [Burkholderia pseudomallei]|uniref:Uncharacterized protein n=2 Tax=Burkholderiaceae TaxID=119060 RepID=Q63WZ4_BURPS|nr:hypothetical protein D0U05_13780 [Burkholderia pseudomallei]RFS62040.1 hypothetical protein D0U02_15185 [Burkholderia pseudomallei]RFS70109.1 hypothetical protein D0U01_05945 [Burkholderia pseudomallei]RFS72947.1 hypothetical protein D0T98_18860 [Burkholderia pseudomallei]CAH34738.1 hypothetical protein BPSL0746 [Burkholderia pseudomallei K96243]
MCISARAFLCVICSNETATHQSVARRHSIFHLGITMYGSTQPRHDKNHRPVPCDTCPQDNPTMLEGYVSDEALALNDCTHIDEMDDGDIRRDGFIEGHCYECNGPDDGDCGDGEDIHEPD